MPTLAERHADLVKQAREAAQALEAAKERFHTLRGAILVVEDQMREEAAAPPRPPDIVTHENGAGALSMLDV